MGRRSAECSLSDENAALEQALVSIDETIAILSFNLMTTRYREKSLHEIFLRRNEADPTREVSGPIESGFYKVKNEGS